MLDSIRHEFLLEYRVVFLNTKKFIEVNVAKHLLSILNVKKGRQVNCVSKR